MTFSTDIIDKVISLDNNTVINEFAPGRQTSETFRSDVDNLDESFNDTLDTSNYIENKYNDVEVELKEGTSIYNYTTFKGLLDKIDSSGDGKKAKLNYVNRLDRAKNISIYLAKNISDLRSEVKSTSEIFSLLETRLQLVPGGSFSTRSYSNEQFYIGKPIANFFSLSSDYPSYDYLRNSVAEGLNDIVYDEKNNCLFIIRRNMSNVSLNYIPETSVDTVLYYNNPNALAKIYRVSLSAKTYTDITTSIFTTDQVYLYGVAQNPYNVGINRNLYILFANRVTTATKAVLQLLVCDNISYTTVATFTGLVTGDIVSSVGIYNPFIDGHFYFANTAGSTRNAIIGIKITSKASANLSIGEDSGIKGWAWVLGTGMFNHAPCGGSYRVYNGFSGVWEVTTYTAKFSNNGYNIYVPGEDQIGTNFQIPLMLEDQKEWVYNRKISGGVKAGLLNYPFDPRWQTKIYLVPRSREDDDTWWDLSKAIEVKEGTVIKRGWYAVYIWIWKAFYDTFTGDIYPNFCLFEQSKESTLFRSKYFVPNIVAIGNTSILTVIPKIISYTNSGYTACRYVKASLYLFKGTSVSINTKYDTWGAGMRISRGIYNNSYVSYDCAYFSGMARDGGHGTATYTYYARQICLFAFLSDTYIYTTGRIPKDCSFPEGLSDRGHVFYYPDPEKESYEDENNVNDNDNNNDSKGEASKYTIVCSGIRNKDLKEYSLEPFGVTDKYGNYYISRRFTNPDKHTDRGDLFLIKDSKLGSVIMSEGCVSGIVQNWTRDRIYYVDRGGYIWEGTYSGELYINLNYMNANVSCNNLFYDLGITEGLLVGITQQGRGYSIKREESITANDTLSATDTNTFTFPQSKDNESYTKKGIKIEIQDIKDVTSLYFMDRGEGGYSHTTKIVLPDILINLNLHNYMNMFSNKVYIIEITTNYYFYYEVHKDQIKLDLTDYTYLNGYYRILKKDIDPDQNTIKWTLIGGEGK